MPPETVPSSEPDPVTVTAAWDRPWRVGMDLRGDFAVVIVAVADQDYRALRPREARDLAAALNDMAERCEK